MNATGATIDRDDLRARRKRLGISQQRLATDAGCSISCIRLLAGCHDCGATRRELNRDRTGDLICGRCFERRYPDETVALGLPKPPRLRRPPDPAWVDFRRKVISALDRDRFLYLGRDECGSTCPSCGDVMHVRFAGCEPAATFTCLGAGCDEGQMLAMLVSGRSVPRRDWLGAVQAARAIVDSDALQILRETHGLLALAPDEVRAAGEACR